jgi:hypothetical protein
MLDAGYCLPAIGFAFRRGGRGCWIKNKTQEELSSHVYPVSSIQYQVSTTTTKVLQKPWPRPGMARCGDGKRDIHKQ